MQLECIRETTNIQWIRNQIPINEKDEINENLKHHQRYNILVNTFGSKLQIYNITSSDQGEYICEGADSSGIFREMTYLCVISKCLLT